MLYLRLREDGIKISLGSNLHRPATLCTLPVRIRQYLQVFDCHRLKHDRLRGLRGWNICGFFRRSELRFVRAWSLFTKVVIDVLRLFERRDSYCSEFGLHSVSDRKVFSLRRQHLYFLRRNERSSCSEIGRKPLSILRPWIEG